MEKKRTKKKKQKWMKFRHRIVRNVVFVFLFVYLKIRFGINIKRFKEQGKRQYLILSNHQTGFDQFYVGIAFHGPVYYIASEDLFSNGFVSRLIKWLVAPIPIKKSANDVSAVMNCMRVAREGGTIALFPEGNRTYSGRTEYIKDSVAQLAKALKLPIAFFHIKGGFGVFPRFADKRRGRGISGEVVRVLEYEDYKNMPNEELYELICKELYVDECVCDKLYKSRHSAEYLERAIYYCPDCGLSVFESHGDTITCKKCEKSIRYLPSKELCGVNFKFKYRFISEWYHAQEDFVRELDLSPYDSTPAYTDTVRLLQVIPYKKKVLISKKADLCVYSDKYTLTYNGKTNTFSFDNVSAATVLGKNKLNIYVGADIYQIKGDKRFNAVKYLNLYYHAAHIKKGDINGEFQFLGL